MDYIGESIALAIDALIFGACIKQYFKNKRAMSMIQGAPYLEINKDLQEIVNTHPDKKLNYVALRGVVKPIGPPITSTNNINAVGAVQLLRIREHVVQRSTAGFWSEHERVIQEVHNVAPFVLEYSQFQIEVEDPLAAEILDMDVISDVFTPTVPTVMDHIWSFFSGLRQRGIQTTEKMLRTGSIITGIGELVATNDGKALKLQPPNNGSPYYLTSMHITSLLKKLDDSKRGYKWFCILFGSVGIVIAGLMLRRFYKDYRRRMEELRIKIELERNRAARRRRARNENLNNDPTDLLCAVCRTNPREIIILPCGHVCLCEDCAPLVCDNCPICRSTIEKKTAAYI